VEVADNGGCGGGEREERDDVGGGFNRAAANNGVLPFSGALFFSPGFPQFSLMVFLRFFHPQFPPPPPPPFAASLIGIAHFPAFLLLFLSNMCLLDAFWFGLGLRRKK
jgi:hypothetical protein